MTSIVEMVKHYQRSIDKSMDNASRLLHCIDKLNKLPVTVDHLQETGVGRTVNNLRKHDGEVGYAARALVTKWKTMVANEEVQNDSDDDDQEMVADEEDDPADADSGTAEDFDPEDDHKLQIDETENIEPEKNTHKNNNHHNSKDSRNKEEKKSSHRSEHHKSDRKHSSHRDRSRSEKSQEKKEKSEKRDTKDDKDKTSHRSKGKSDRHSKSSNSDSSSGSSSSENRQSSKVDYKQKTSSSSASDVKTSSDKYGSDSKKAKHHSSSSSSKSTQSSKEIKEIKENKEIKEKVYHSSHEDSSDNKKDKSSRKKSSKSDKTDKSKKETKESSKESTRDKDTKHEKSSSSKASSSSSSKDKEKSGSKKPVKTTHQTNFQIDSSMGASFADALGMLDMPSSSSSSKISKIKSVPVVHDRPSTSSSTSSSIEKLTPSNSNKKFSSSSTSTSKRNLEETPELLTKRQKLDPLPDITDDIPSTTFTISNNYKPLPLNPVVMDCLFQQGQGKMKQMTEDEQLSISISSKTMKTKVFSGNKVAPKGIVPSLFDMCIHVLQDNIDCLEYTGGVPFDILKPVLLRATVDQLMVLEDFNPYLIEDTDPLWEQHCKRRFRGKHRQELESWREMYFRCTEEEQAKFKSLTENIKMAREKSLPVRKTKLAYVDSVVKPPRSVKAQQTKNGTATLAIVSPASRVESLNGIGRNLANIGDTRIKVANAIRESISQQPTYKPNPNRKAPLMQKTLMSMKKAFKR